MVIGKAGSRISGRVQGLAGGHEYCSPNREPARATSPTNHGKTPRQCGQRADVVGEPIWRPVISVQHASEVTGLAYPNANNLVSKFEELRLLREISGQKRNRRFAYEPYLQLFADSAPSHPMPESDDAKTERAD